MSLQVDILFSRILVANIRNKYSILADTLLNIKKRCDSVETTSGIDSNRMVRDLRDINDLACVQSSNKQVLVQM